MRPRKESTYMPYSLKFAKTLHAGVGFRNLAHPRNAQFATPPSGLGFPTVPPLAACKFRSRTQRRAGESALIEPLQVPKRFRTRRSGSCLGSSRLIFHCART